MNINLNKAKKEFIKYTEQYNLENENIKRKQLHSIRVMELSKEIATKLGMPQEDIDLATLIGLLHDIARFEQYTQFQTFRDLESFDHGDYAIKILEKDIRKYIETDSYDDIIKVAIKNHNKYQIEEGLKDKELVFAKIVRDADKLDIFYESVEMFWNGIENQINDSKISENVMNEFKTNRQITRKKNSSNNPSVNEVISVIAFIFDMNFKESFEILQKEDYINKILNRFNFKDEETKDGIKEIRSIANAYIKNNI
ncbi:MAG: HD domain-containing protein [Clostridia bacterium]|nr:HD domain-containing protein [Clostridia bacterium]